MEDSKILDLIDHQRWLLNNGIVNDMAKDNLYVFGSLLHKEIGAVELAINIEKKNVAYTIFGNPKLIKVLSKYQKLSTSDSIFSLWQMKRLIKREGNLNFKGMLSRFVKDYCGASWSVDVEVKPISIYSEGYVKESGREAKTGAGIDLRPFDR